MTTHLNYHNYWGNYTWLSIYIYKRAMCFLFCFSFSLCHLNHRRSWQRTTPLFLTFCLQIYFQYNFFISLLFHLFFLILTCSCQYSYNHMLTSNCMCRPYIDTNNPGRHMQFDVNIRLYEYWHEQVKIRKKRWNKEILLKINL